MCNYDGGNITLENVLFDGNSAQVGAAISNSGSGMLLRHVILRNNFALNGQNSSGALFNNFSGRVTIEDSTFDHNTGAWYAGGVVNDGGTVELTRVTFTGNRGTYGGAVTNLKDSILVVNDSVFRGNYGQDGGGIYDFWGVLTVNNSTFHYNGATFGGGIYLLYVGSAAVANAVFTGNYALDGGGMATEGSTGSVRNASFAGNSAWYGGGFYGSYSNIDLRNGLFWGNPTLFESQVTGANVSYSLVQGGAAGIGNLDADPQLVDANGADNQFGTPDDDLRLRAGSPAIDAGDNDALPMDSLDRDGNPRFVDDSTAIDTGHGSAPLIDIGAYEYQLDLPLSKPLNLFASQILRSQVVLNWTDTSANEVGFLIERSSDSIHWRAIGQVGADVTTYADRLLPCNTLYAYRVRAFNAEGNSAFDNVVVATTSACMPATIYVDGRAGAGANDGGPWVNAFVTLQDALTVARPGDQIWVAEGTYRPGANRDATFALKGGIALYGGFAGTEALLTERDWQAHPSILSGDIGQPDTVSDNSYHVITLTDAQAATLLDGFTISGGNADKQYVDQSGGGLYVRDAQLTLRNTMVLGNAGWQGGGGLLAVDSKLWLDRVTFRGNRTEPLNSGMWIHGGGMSTFGGELTISNTTFEQNASIRGGGLYTSAPNARLKQLSFRGNTAMGDGGGLANEAVGLHLSDAQFIRNSAGSGGGMYVSGQGAAIVNVILQGNQAYSGGGMTNWGADSAIGNAILVGNSATQGGAFYNASASFPTLSGATISENTASEAGGAIFNYVNSYIAVRNSIIWSNHAPVDAQISAVDPELITVRYSLISGGYTGTGNHDRDPRFARNPTPGADAIWGTADDDYGDMHLRLDSPAIDAGDNTAVLSDTTDLDGDGNIGEVLPFDLDRKTRFVDTASTADSGNGFAPIADLGAYERDLARATLTMELRSDAAQVSAGGTMDLHIVVANSGPDSAQQVVVTTTLPAGTAVAGFTYRAATASATSWDCKMRDVLHQLVCITDHIEAGDTSELTFTVNFTNIHGHVTFSTEVAALENVPPSQPVAAEISVLVADPVHPLFLPLLRAAQ